MARKKPICKKCGKDIVLDYGMCQACLRDWQVKNEIDLNKKLRDPRVVSINWRAVERVH